MSETHIPTTAEAQFALSFLERAAPVELPPGQSLPPGQAMLKTFLPVIPQKAVIVNGVVKGGNFYTSRESVLAKLPGKSGTIRITN